MTVTDTTVYSAMDVAFNKGIALAFGYDTTDHDVVKCVAAEFGLDVDDFSVDQIANIAEAYDDGVDVYFDDIMEDAEALGVYL